MASSPVEIASRALHYMGVPADMQTLEDTKPPEALWVGRLYNSSRMQILSMHPWGFATRTARLEEADSGIDHPSWAYSYIIPEGTLRVLSAGVEGSGSPLPFELESGFLHANFKDLVARLVFDQQDTTKYDPLFTECFAFYLASQAAVPSSLGQEVADRLAAAFAAMMPVSAGVDASQSMPLQPFPSRRATWQQMRGLGGA